MPAEWAPHERTLMAWPARAELWGTQLAQAKADYVATAVAVASFEPLMMVCADETAVAEARAALPGEVEVVVEPIDDSWLRDSGPIFVTDGRPPAQRRAGVHFDFNAWGEKFHPYDKDAAIGGRLVERVGDPCYRAPLVLEGGSICTDGEGTLITTEQCLLHPSRNPGMSRAEIEQSLIDHLGIGAVVWLGQGLVEDRDTDGHVDLIAAFTKPGKVLLQTVPEGNPNFDNCRENARRLEEAGIDVVEMPHLPYSEVCGETVACGYMNFYLCNDAVIVPVCGADTDPDALARIAEAYPGREAVPVPGALIAWGGGGPHCITQQVPAKS
ncbi:MAG TPA: agmatine deiminase family protein [Solirubrobacteraceae bacterium]|nr:agmatine deiminase family protein [Solirubrobacteraceae bacterium]